MIDPVCLIHGKKMSEHTCLYCCLCYETLTPEQCSVNQHDGTLTDVCMPCAEEERKFVCKRDGTQIAAEMRAQANTLTPEQRQAAMETAVQIIKST